MRIKRKTDKQLKNDIIFFNVATILNLIFGISIFFIAAYLAFYFDMYGYALLGFILGTLDILTGFVFQVIAEQNKVILEIRRKK